MTISWSDIEVGLGTGLISGVLSGVVVWFLTAKAFAPRLGLGPALVRQSSGEYQIEIQNLPVLGILRWAALDVQVTARLHIDGLDQDAPMVSHNYIVPVENDGVIVRFRSTFFVKIETDQIDLQRLPRLAAALGDTGTALPDLLRVGTEAQLRVAVTATNAVTRALFQVDKRYDSTALTEGSNHGSAYGG